MRKTKEILITTEGRDKGKTFVLTEPSSYDAERIAVQILGIATMADAADAGFAQLVVRVPPEKLDTLFRELMQCVSYRHQPKHPLQAIKEGEECQIDEVATRMQLKNDVFELIMGF